MTITVETAREEYVAGGLTTFTYNWRILDESDLTVYLRDTSGVETLQALTTDYTVTGVGNAGGGSVIFNSAPTATDTVVIYVDPDITQLTDYSTGGSFPAESHENALDKLTLIAKRTRDMVARALRLGDGAASTNSTYDADGSRIVDMGTPVDDTDAATKNYVDAAIASNVLADNTTVITANGSNYVIEELAYQTNATGTVLRRLNNGMGDVLSVKDFGALGDGSTDDRAAIQAALDAADDIGAVVYFPPGQYYVNSTVASLTVENVTLLGTGAHDGTNNGGLDTGSSFLIEGDATNPFIDLFSNTVIDGLGFYYNNQADSASPTAHAPTIDARSGAGALNFVTIRNCVFYNSYIAMAFDNTYATGLGHVWIENNTIFGINAGLRINGNNEVFKIHGNSFTFGHNLNATESGLRSYNRASGTNIDIYGQSDGTYITNNLFFGAVRGINYTGQSSTFQKIIGNSFDQTVTGIYCNASGAVQQSHVKGNNFICYNTQNTSIIGYGMHWDKLGAAALDTCLIEGNYFAQTTGDHINYTANLTNSRIDIVANTLELNNNSNTGTDQGSIVFNSANDVVFIEGNRFSGANNNDSNGIILTAANVAMVKGNWFEKCYDAIRATAVAWLEMTGNTAFTSINKDYARTTVTTEYQSENFWTGTADQRVVTAAATLNPQTFGSDAIVLVNGNTTITDMAAAPAGRKVMLSFNDTVTVADGNNLTLAGNFSATAGDTLTLISDGTTWNELSRSDNA